MLWTRSSIPLFLCFLLHVTYSCAFYIGSAVQHSIIRWNPRHLVATTVTTNNNQHVQQHVQQHEEQQHEIERNELTLTPAEIRLLSSNDRYAHRIQQLIQFHQQHGHFCVRERHDKTLSQWVRTQQYEYKRWMEGLKSLITLQRIEQLNDIGFEWETNDGLTKDWMTMFHTLQAFKQQHGHLRLGPRDGPLGKWVANQRHQYSKYQLQDKSSLITPSRIDKLNDIGMIWDRKATQTTRHDDKWENSLQQLKVYRNQHGHCQVPKSAGSLGLWVSNQRIGYARRMKNLPSTLTINREQKLVAVGLDLLVPTHQDQWTRKYQELCEFHVQYGHFRVPAGPLGTWVARQRRDNKTAQKQKPNGRWKDREALLRAIGFFHQTNYVDEQWEKRFSELLVFYREHGHCQVPNGPLRQWIKRQQKAVHSKRNETDVKQSHEREQRLRTIGLNLDDFVKVKVDRLTTDWMTKYQELNDFYAIHGHVRLTSYDGPLGKWVARQRVQYHRYQEQKQAFITPARIQLLNSVGMIWNVTAAS